MSTPFQPLDSRADLAALWRALRALQGIQPLPAGSDAAANAAKINELIAKLKDLTRR